MNQFYRDNIIKIMKKFKQELVESKIFTIFVKKRYGKDLSTIYP